MQRPPNDERLGWIAELVISLVTIGTKLYQAKRAKDKVRRERKLQTLAARKVQADIAKAQAAIDSAGGGPVGLPLTAGPGAGMSGKTLALVAVGAGALFLLTRKARRRA